MHVDPLLRTIPTSSTSWKRRSGPRPRDHRHRARALADLAGVEKRLDKATRTAKSGDAQAETAKPVSSNRCRPFWPRAAGAHRGAHRGGGPDLPRPSTSSPRSRCSTPPTCSRHEIARGQPPRRGPPAPPSRRTASRRSSSLFSGKVEAELSELPLADRAEFLASLGVTRVGPDIVSPRPRITCWAYRAISPPVRKSVRACGPFTGATRPRRRRA